ncbi:hypothetical protein NOCA1130230 [metagenome]|uniref:PPE family domain-containing protein n=1 Tax=metagenome TaxID=256318 RepID=A0A2P2C720_9ZZZZ
MPANLWELRADVRPLDVAAVRWGEVAALMTRRGDEIVSAALRATEGWDSAAAESYDQFRRQVLANLDRFTTLATQIAGSLQAVSSIITSAQKELDQAWAKVELVPHEVVGETRYLVFRPEADDDRVKVTAGEQEAQEIRQLLTLALDQESTRLRSARAEFVLVRTELTTLAGGTFARGLQIGEDESGVGTVPVPSTSVLGSAQGGAGGVAGAAGLPPIAPISVSMPHLTGITAAGLAPIIATAAGGAPGLRGASRPPAGGVPAAGGMAAGMGVRAGSMSRGMAGGRSGSQRLATPRLSGQGDDDSRPVRDKDLARDAAKEAKRAALEEKRAARAARKAEREAGKDEQDRPGEPEVEKTDEAEDVLTVVEAGEATHDDAPSADREADDRGAGR